MLIKFHRDQFRDDCTLGQVYVDGIWQAFCLEDRVREIPGDPVSSWKIDGMTAIPRGRYRCAITFSHRFQKHLPELFDVPGFTGVRIHGGLTDADTAGCLLVGQARNVDSLVNSQAALRQLMAKMEGQQDIVVEVA